MDFFRACPFDDFFNSPVGGLQENIFSTALCFRYKNHEVAIVCKKEVFSDRLWAVGVSAVFTDYALFFVMTLLR